LRRRLLHDDFADHPELAVRRNQARIFERSGFREFPENLSGLLGAERKPLGSSYIRVLHGFPVLQIFSGRG
jgi:hypothetical protein